MAHIVVVYQVGYSLHPVGFWSTATHRSKCDTEADKFQFLARRKSGMFGAICLMKIHS